VRLRSVKSFLRSIGVNLLIGSEQVMRDQLEDDAARYQAGTVNGITYCRCEDIVTELREFVKECALAGQLKRRLGAPDDALRVTVSIDKGGSYTKAFITVWDADQSLSPLRAVLMGVYCGTDDREAIKAVFGPAMAHWSARRRTSIGRISTAPATTAAATARSRRVCLGRICRMSAATVRRSKLVVLCKSRFVQRRIGQFASVGVAISWYCTSCWAHRDHRPRTTATCVRYITRR